MPTARRPSSHDELPTLDIADLTHVTGGAGDDMSSLAMMMAMRKRGAQTAAAAPAPAATSVPPWQPQITVDGQPQQLTDTGNGTYSTSTSA